MSLRISGSVPFLALVLAACASSGSQQPSGNLAPTVQHPGTIHSYGGQINYDLPADGNVVSSIMKATPAEAWNALVTVFDDAKIPVTEKDERTFMVGNRDFTVRRELLGQRLSYFLDCGNGFTGPTANSARVSMSIRGQVVQAGEGEVRVDLLVSAVAHPTQGTSTGAAPCGSSQRLEREILKRVQLHLVGATR